MNIKLKISLSRDRQSCKTYFLLDDIIIDGIGSRIKSRYPRDREKFSNVLFRRSEFNFNHIDNQVRSSIRDHIPSPIMILEPEKKLKQKLRS